MLEQTILIVEDEENLLEALKYNLEHAGYQVVTAADGGKGLEIAREADPALVILDIMLPTMDGLEVCRLLRRTSDVPVLMLTAKTEEVDKVVGLEMGADDYVVKPFSPRELIERIKAILRRTKYAPMCRNTKLSFGNLLMEPEKHKLTRNGKPISLTPSEYVLLQTLMSSPGRVFSRHELLTKLYQTSDAVVDRVVDVHIGKLRQKIEYDPANPHLILTTRGVGYCFTDEEKQGGN